MHFGCSQDNESSNYSFIKNMSTSNLKFMNIY